MNSDLIERLRERARYPNKATDMSSTDWPARVYPPISPSEVAAAEVRLGFSLPESLRDIFVHVGNGGFGPAYGLLGLPGGAVNEDDLNCLSLYSAFLANDPDDPFWKWPERLLPLGHLGCAMYACVDCTTPDSAIIWFEPNPHTDGEAWDNSFIPLAPSLSAWLADWLDGTADLLFERAWNAKFPPV